MDILNRIDGQEVRPALVSLGEIGLRAEFDGEAGDLLLRPPHCPDREPYRWRLVTVPTRLLEHDDAAWFLRGALRAEGHRRALLLPRATRSMIERLRYWDVDYLDSSGNCRLIAPGIHVQVEGRPASSATAGPLHSSPQGYPRPEQADGGILTPTACQVVFALLLRPSLAREPLRRIAQASAVSVGSAQAAVRGLASHGHIEGSRRGRCLIRHHELARKWAVAFTERLVPRLETQRMSTGLSMERLVDAMVGTGTATVGGEWVAAPLRHTGSVVLYADGRGIEARRAGRLRPDVEGAVHLRRRFWSEADLRVGPYAPDLLIAADLLAVGDDRAREVGEELLLRATATAVADD